MAGSITGRGWAILVVAFTVAQAMQQVAPETPPESGTWHIDRDVVLRDGTFYLNGSVMLYSSGSLTIINSSLILNIQRIDVQGIGRLSMDNTSVSVSDNLTGSGSISIYETTSDFRHCSFRDIGFILSSSVALFADCDFSKMGAWISTSYGSGGIGLSVNNCTFVDTGLYALSCYHSGLSVTGSRFFHRASDRVDSPPQGKVVETPRQGVRVLGNRFVGLGTGVRFNEYPYQMGDTAINIHPDDQLSQLVCNNTVAGFQYGVSLEQDPSGAVGIEVSGNHFRDCTLGISCADSSESDNMVFSENEIEGGMNGMVLAVGKLAVISNNTISNCSVSGFSASTSDWWGVSPTISGNRVTRCPYGAYFFNVQCTLRFNNISDCAVAGIFATINRWYYYQISIKNNTLSRCGFDGSDFSIQPAAIYALATDQTPIIISGNRLTDNPGYGIRAYGNVQVDNNTVEGSGTGIDCTPDDLGRSRELARNRVMGGRTGIRVGSVSKVSENDVSDVRFGIVIDTAQTPGAPLLASNAIHASETGIHVRGPTPRGEVATILGNVVAAGIDGVLLDSVQGDVRGNDFGGTSGFCVHAIGEGAVLSNNSYGSGCAGRLLQEWYLTVRALESPDPYNSAQWSYTDRFSVRILNDTGCLSYSGDSGSSLSVYLNLTGHTIDRGGNRTNFVRYGVTAMKPHVGVGWAPVTLVENSGSSIQLLPRSDLAVQDIVLPGGHPVPGQAATVEVSVVHDTTYDTLYSALGPVSVALRDNGLPIGEKLIPRLEPNATATVRFGWPASGGNHELAAMVDPDQRLPEAFEDNNVLYLEVSVNEPPVPVLSVSDLNPAAGRTVAFSSNGSTDDEGVVRSLFDFGDGTESGWTADTTVLHVYAMPGIYEVRLMVADAEGATSDWCPPEFVTVTEGSLQASIAASSTLLETLVPVELSASVEGSPGAQCSFGWDFGDGRSELGLVARRTHAYTRPGNFTVTVTVTDPVGRRGSASIELSVRNRAPNALLAFSPSDPTVLTSVQFRSLSGDPDGVIGRWLWDFGDENQSAGPAPRHLYREKGTYTVTLSVQDDSGAWSAAAVEQLTVKNIPPAARASSSAETVRAGGSVRLEAGLTVDPDDPPSALAFRWESGDGWLSTSESATRRFPAPGRYRMTLTVTDSSGATSEDTVTVQVLPAEDPGGMGYRPVAIGLSVAAVALFSAAFYVFGRDRTEYTPQRTLSCSPAKGRGQMTRRARPVIPPPPEGGDVSGGEQGSPGRGRPNVARARISLPRIPPGAEAPGIPAKSVKGAVNPKARQRERGPS